MTEIYLYCEQTSLRHLSIYETLQKQSIVDKNASEHIDEHRCAATLVVK